MDYQKNELYETALFRKFKESLEKEKELQIYNNTHIDKFYKAMPCTIRPRKIENSPIIIAQMLSKNIVFREQFSQMEIQESDRSRVFSRIQTPSKNDDRQNFMRSLVYSRREKQRSSSVKSDVFDLANIQLNQNINDLPKKLRTSKCKRAQLYFCSHLRDRIKSPRLGITIPQYLASKIKSIK
ncbi:unnamed protein product [Paramecium sonneborni]|uniref:Uncharacterized protein n=1 Tax=Paramecium sonneborni TaxID=65129 RepID=A0A8S1L5K0_9CILI|nr:unnamed protein product [Paramecium sonneborni]